MSVKPGACPHHHDAEIFAAWVITATAAPDSLQKTTKPSHPQRQLVGQPARAARLTIAQERTSEGHFAKKDGLLIHINAESHTAWEEGSAGSQRETAMIQLVRR
jgi:hypothetical protein